MKSTHNKKGNKNAILYFANSIKYLSIIDWHDNKFVNNFETGIHYPFD